MGFTESLLADVAILKEQNQQLEEDNMRLESEVKSARKHAKKWKDAKQYQVLRCEDLKKENDRLHEILKGYGYGDN